MLRTAIFAMVLVGYCVSSAAAYTTPDQGEAASNRSCTASRECPNRRRTLMLWQSLCCTPVAQQVLCACSCHCHAISRRDGEGGTKLGLRIELLDMPNTRCDEQCQLRSLRRERVVNHDHSYCCRLPVPCDAVRVKTPSAQLGMHHLLQVRQLAAFRLSGRSNRR